jgi:L(+)-tartrate dehydratase alpha subunit
MMAIEDKEVAREAAAGLLTDMMASFTAYVGKRLPTDVEHKLADLRGKETMRWPRRCTSR